MAAFRSLKTAPGAVVVQMGRNVVVLPTEAISLKRAKRIAEHTRGLMLGNHFVEAMQDMGFTLSCELVETLYALDGAEGDFDKVTRLNDEADRFAISLQQFEKHPFVFIHHDREEMMTQIVPMRDLKKMDDFKAWKAGLPSPRDRELMGFEPMLV
ncbi:hypothetical protein FF100_13455 [Methylobacterium terricola]|uniref:Uncharacterized protein n=1 Tax=Methylobacterium terricola TaxID=2583531 RepID=A0A5C4LFZ7_9HYPH|nr:hypothetical protein [Methylobacterium terricola]TNC12679.1 hypothetical protein FF100_13455 [Methylobacterium terricola]